MRQPYDELLADVHAKLAELERRAKDDAEQARDVHKVLVDFAAKFELNDMATKGQFTGLRYELIHQIHNTTLT